MLETGRDSKKSLPISRKREITAATKFGGVMRTETHSVNLQFKMPLL